MTHFLSSVTQQRLEVRKVDMERTDAPSLVCNPEPVYGQLRCVAATATAPTTNQHGDAGQVPCVWCGEQDGSITVRSGAGAHVLHAVARKQLRSGAHAFVFCLCTPRHDQVWAGLSDGSIRVFHPRTCEVLFEFHAHASSVVSLAVVSMPTNDGEFEHHMNIVVSASTDWTIAKWDTTTFQCLGKLLGHRVAIRCLAPSQSGEFLVSGGEDGTLRMWSLLRNEEVIANHDGIATEEVSFSTEAHGQRDLSPNIKWPVPAHDAGVSGVCIIRDEIIVSTGLDGVALLWSLGGECLHELDRRTCGLSSVVHDVTCARIWIGGIDGNINLFSDDPDLQWQPLGTARDHSGAYVSMMSVTRVDHLQRMWLLDENGVATYFTETLVGESDVTLGDDQEVDGPSGSDHLMQGVVSSDVCAALEDLDDLRQTAVQSYSELRKHRLRLAGAEAFQRKQRERLVLAFGDSVRERQSTVYRLQRWLERKKFLAVTRLRCEWMERASHRAFLSICMWRWLLYARECAVTNTKSRLADALRALTASTLKSHTARQLKLSLQERERWRNLSRLVGILEVRGSNVTRSLYFGKWMAALVTQRKAANRTYLASARTRLSDITSQHVHRRNHTLALMIDSHAHRLQYLAAQLQVLNDGPCTLRYYTRWTQYVAQRRTERRRGDALAANALQRYDRTVLLQSYRRWQRHAAERSKVHEQERNGDLEAELRMWQDLIREASTTTIDVLQREQAAEVEKATQRKDALGELKDKASSILEDIHMIKSDLVASGLRLQPGLDLDAKVDAIFTYMKARGINAHRDVGTISAAREAFAVLPLYIAPTAAPSPGLLGRGSPVRKSSTGGGRRASSPAAGQRAAPPKKKAPPKPRSLLIELEDGLKHLQALVTQAVRGADAGILQQADQQMRHSDDVLDDNDWCVTPESIQRLTRKDLRESAACLRRIIVLYDCIRCKQEESASATPMYRSAPAAPPPPAIPAEVLRIILCNAASMIKLATHDFSLSALEYVTAEEGSPSKVRSDDAPVAPRPAAARKALPIPGSTVRRHSSPASNRTATPTRAAARPASPAQTQGKASPAPKPATPRPVLRTPASASPARQSVEEAAEGDGASPAAKPLPKQASPKQHVGPKPFLGLRVSVGPPLTSTSRVPSLVVAECNERYPIEGPEGPLTLEGPAFAAGLRVGDVIVRFAGYAVADLAAFNAIVSRHCKPNAVIPLQVQSSASKETRVLSITVKAK